jgi:S1-C subfamily serine protease
MERMSAPGPFRLAALCVSLIVVVTAIAVVGPRDDRASTPVAAAQVPLGPPSPSGGFSQMVARATPSVVQIRSSIGLGSGIVYDDAGHVVTNAHVVVGSKHFKVTDVNGARHSATLTGVFAEGDLAVIDVAGGKLTPATFADSSQVHTGDYSLAIGNPLGLRSSVTMGIISATSRTVSEGSGVALPSVIQTSAPINPGNSGGALVDADGSVIGVPTLAALDPELGDSAAPGIGFAISSNTVRSIAPQLIQHGRVLDTGRASLGVELRTLPGGKVFVAAVTPNGPADRAGIAAGDQLVRIAGKRATSADAVSIALAEQRPGAAVPVKVRDAGGTRTVQVTLGQMPAAK